MNSAEIARKKMELFDVISNIRRFELSCEENLFNLVDEDRTANIIFDKDEVEKEIILEEIAMKGREGYRYLQFIMEHQTENMVVKWFMKLSAKLKIMYINLMVRECRKSEEISVIHYISYMTIKEINYSDEGEPLILITSIKYKKNSIRDYLIKNGAKLNEVCKCAGICAEDLFTLPVAQKKTEKDYILKAQEHFKEMVREFKMDIADSNIIFNINPFKDLKENETLWSIYVLVLGLDLIFDEDELIEEMVSAKIEKRSFRKYYIPQIIKIGEVREITAGILSSNINKFTVTEYIVSAKNQEVFEKKHEIVFAARDCENVQTTFNRYFGFRHNISIYFSEKILMYKENREFGTIEEVDEDVYEYYR